MFPSAKSQPYSHPPHFSQFSHSSHLSINLQVLEFVFEVLGWLKFKFVSMKYEISENRNKFGFMLMCAVSLYTTEPSKLRAR